MSLITNLGIDEYDDQSIPNLLTLTFCNGEKASYQRTSEERSRIQGGSQKLNSNNSKFDLPDEKIDEHTFEAMIKNCEQRLVLLNKQHKVAFDEAELIFEREQEDFEKKCKQQKEMLEKERIVRNKQISDSYQELKKNIDVRMAELRNPSERLKIMVGWLRAADVSEFSKVADMLEINSGYIEENIIASHSESAEIKWDTFLSHVQKFSGDMCRNLTEALSKEGITA